MHKIECQEAIKNEKTEGMTDVVFDKLTSKKKFKKKFKLLILNYAASHHLTIN